MPKTARKARRSSNQDKQGKSIKMTNTVFEKAPRDLASLIRGLYGRVARQLSFDPSYVSRVARGERRSQRVEYALRSELNRIVEHINKRRTAAAHKSATSKKVR